MSIYCKDDLPTWHEIYYEFYLKDLFNYDCNDTELDLYWKIPHKKMIIGFVCNQLNKMIFEDKKCSIEEVNKIFNDDFKNFYFVLSNDIEVCDEGAPSIYALKIPSTKQFSIFSSTYRRKDLAEIDKNFSLKLILVRNNYDFKIIENTDLKFREVLIKVIDEILDYFREPIGWK